LKRQICSAGQPFVADLVEHGGDQAQAGSLVGKNDDEGEAEVLEDARDNEVGDFDLPGVQDDAAAVAGEVTHMEEGLLKRWERSRVIFGPGAIRQESKGGGSILNNQHRMAGAEGNLKCGNVKILRGRENERDADMSQAEPSEICSLKEICRYRKG